MSDEPRHLGGDYHRADIHAGRDITVGGDFNVNSPRVDARSIVIPSEELRRRVTDLVRVVETSAGPGVDPEPVVQDAAWELDREVSGARTRRERIEALLGTIAARAEHVAAVSAAIAAVRDAIGA